MMPVGSFLKIFFWHLGSKSCETGWKQANSGLGEVPGSKHYHHSSSVMCILRIPLGGCLVQSQTATGRQTLFVLARDLVSGSHVGQMRSPGKVGWRLCVWLGRVELETVLVKEKISRAHEFIHRQPLTVFCNCSRETVSWSLMIETFLHFQEWEDFFFFILSSNMFLFNHFTLGICCISQCLL